MKTLPPSVVPIFRSDGQARVLAWLFLHPGRRVSVSELAREVGLDPATVQREVTRLERGGVVGSERVGTARVVTVREASPIYRELMGLVLKTLGPPTVLGRELAPVDGVEAAFVFGSWAARMAGTPGDDPADIDVLIVGTPNRGAVSAACARAAGVLGRDVQPTVVSPGDWEPPRTGFLRSIKRGPLIAVPMGDEGG